MAISIFTDFDWGRTLVDTTGIIVVSRISIAVSCIIVIVAVVASGVLVLF